MTTTPAATPPGIVAILGGGIIGAGWAAFFALRGYAVRVADPSDTAPAVVAATLEKARPAMQALGLLSDAPTIPHVVADVRTAVLGATHIQEALPEQIDIKHAVYALVESIVSPDTIIASSSSGFTPSALQEHMHHPERLLVVHPCNPPYLMPLVELVGGKLTSPDVLDATEKFYQANGKQTVRMLREAPGHLANRLQAALWREAVHLVAEGYASVADVDRVITEGLGPRWSVCGPHMIFHLSGGDAGMQGFLDKLGPAITSWWDDLGNPVLDARTCKVLVDGMAEAAAGRSYTQLATERDQGSIPVMLAARQP